MFGCSKSSFLSNFDLTDVKRIENVKHN